MCSRKSRIHLQKEVTVPKKRRRKRTRVKPSDELLDGVEELVLAYIKKRGGSSYWSHIFGEISGCLCASPSGIAKEWRNLSSYGTSKVLGMVMDRLEQTEVVMRKKNYHPYILMNALDRIVKALDEDQAAELIV